MEAAKESESELTTSGKAESDDEVIDTGDGKGNGTSDGQNGTSTTDPGDV